MSLEPDGVIDASARLIVTAALFIWILYQGASIENPYPESLVKLYEFPFWRLVLAIGVLVASYWCPRVGAMFALAIFFYFDHMEKLRRPWIIYTN